MLIHCLTSFFSRKGTREGGKKTKAHCKNWKPQSNILTSKACDTIFLGLTALAGIEQHSLMVHWSTCLMNPTKQVHSMELACHEFITSGFLLGHTPYRRVRRVTSRGVSNRIANNCSFLPFLKSPTNFSELCIFSCSLDHNFSSTHSIFIILGFLEVERYQGENEVDHDRQDTVQSCTYPALWLFIAVECKRRCEKMPQTKKCPKLWGIFSHRRCTLPL